MITTSDTYTITGLDAIRIAKRDHLTMRKYADPTEGERSGVTVADAEKIAAEDSSLIYIEVVPFGWTDPERSRWGGVFYADYWDRSGNYLGPDSDGVEPLFYAA